MAAKKKYKFNILNNILSFYVCQDRDNARVSECVNLKETIEGSSALWQFNVRKNLRYEVSIEPVYSLKHFINRIYYKFFVTLIDKDSRGIVTNAFIHNVKNIILKSEYYLRDDGSENILLIKKDSQDDIRTFKIKSKTLKVHDGIEVFKLSYEEAKQTSFFVENPRVKFYQMNTNSHKTVVFADETADKQAEISYLTTLIPNFPFIKTCNSPYPDFYGTFDYKQRFRLIVKNERKTFPRYVKLINDDTHKEIGICIQKYDKQEFSLRYEYAGYKDILILKWNFNSEYNINGVKSKFCKMYLSHQDVSQPSVFNFELFDYPKFKERSIFISISKLPHKSLFKLQGIYFKKSQYDGLIIHPEKDNLTVQNVPNDFYFNKDYSVFKKTLEPILFVSQTVNYLSDNEIVYTIKNECSEKYTPTLKLSDDKDIIINCVWIKNLVPFSTSDSIENNSQKLTIGISSMINQLALMGKRII